MKFDAETALDRTSDATRRISHLRYALYLRKVCVCGFCVVSIDYKYRNTSDMVL